MLIGLSSATLTRDAKEQVEKGAVAYETMATTVGGIIIPVSLRCTRVTQRA